MIYFSFKSKIRIVTLSYSIQYRKTLHSEFTAIRLHINNALPVEDGNG